MEGALCELVMVEKHPKLRDWQRIQNVEGESHLNLSSQLHCLSM